MTTSSTEPAADAATPHCPICNDLGFVRLDVPMDDPRFGRLQVCVCRQEAVEEAAHQRLYRLSNLAAFETCQFDTFRIEGRGSLGDAQVESLRQALSLAEAYARSLDGWLVLMGGYGCGKTHLAAAIGNYRTGMGEEPLFVVVPDLLDHLRSTFSPTSRTTYDRVFDEVRTTPLLVLDDLGTQSATPWAREKLYQIFNYRYNARLPLVITTAASLEEIDPRIRSRMLDSRLCTIHAILAPSYRPAPAAPRKPRPTRSRD